MAVQPIKDKPNSAPAHVTHPHSSSSSRSTALTYKITIVVLMLLLLGAVVFGVAGIMPGAEGNRAAAESNTVGLYRLLSGDDVEVLKTVEQNGLYRLTVRFKDASGRDTLQDVFVTKDGMYFTDRLLSVDVQRSLLINQSAFAECLTQKQVRVLGLSTDAATQAQLQVLGLFAGRVYVDCGGQNLPLCQQLNITQVPVIFADGALHQGPQNLAWFEQTTGCSMTMNGTAQP